MAQLAASIVSYDDEFKRQVAALLRSCGVPVGIMEERRAGGEAAGPDVVVIDIRADASSGMAAIERLRAGHPTVALFAIATAADPDLILQAMRAGANEFFPWIPGGDSSASRGLRSWAKRPLRPCLCQRARRRRRVLLTSVAARGRWLRRHGAPLTSGLTDERHSAGPPSVTTLVRRAAGLLSSGPHRREGPQACAAPRSPTSSARRLPRRRKGCPFKPTGMPPGANSRRGGPTASSKAE